MADAPNSYDELPYGFGAFTTTHPDRLATVALLHGLEPPPVERGRVLELGCGMGGNLIPMAEALPEARFLGIDLSARQVAHGLEAVAAVGLSNIELRPQDILGFDAPEGSFDFILCHGVYSWVPPEVQRQILAICRRCLSPQGLAVVSYNAYPGWHLYQMVRQVLQFGARGGKGPMEKVERGLSFLVFLAKHLPHADTPYGQMLKATSERLLNETPSYVYHEYLEEYNEPLYFEQFAAQVEEAGLQYLQESRFAENLAPLSEEARQVVLPLSDNPVRFEQCIDFLRSRTFRSSILCRPGRSPLRQMDPRKLRGMELVGLCTPSSQAPQCDGEQVEKFKGADGVEASTNNPFLKTALMALHERVPLAVPFPQLWQTVRTRLGDRADKGDSPEPDITLLAQPLLTCTLASLVEPHVHSPAIAAEPSERPVATRYSRYLSGQTDTVVNLRHRAIVLDAPHKSLLTLLDGTRGPADLADELERQLRSGQLPATEELSPAGQPSRPAVEEFVHRGLANLARQSLLVKA